MSAARKTTRPKIEIPVYGDPLAPLCVLEQRCSPEPELYPAYIDIDTRAGEIEGGYNPEPGGVPERVHRDLVIRIYVPPAVSGPDLEKYLKSKDFRALYRRIVAGHTIEYRDGRRTGVLDDDAREAVQEVEQEIGWLDRVEVEDVYEAVAGDFEDEVTADTTDEELQKMADDISKRCRSSGVVLVGDEPIDALMHLRDEAA